MVKSKWKREYKVSQDKKQMLLNPVSRTGTTSKMETIATMKYNMTDHFLCPFCLHDDTLQHFLVSTKKGISSKQAQCPECKQVMRMESLTEIKTPEQYAEFAYPYAASGFWQKVPFNTWKERLKKIGWSFDFWRRYKELKGDEENESYDEYIVRKQEEDYNQAEMHDE